MIRYRLDDLGWFQFEWLVQVLLKEELGIGVQSWGGHRDCGRDALYIGRLRFPNRKELTEGPFLFQVKFVEEANAAGAKPQAAIRAAVREEAASIKDRLNSVFADSREFWQELRHYVLLTNAPLTPADRTVIIQSVNAVIPETIVHPMSGSDICDLIDQHPNAKRAFPQLLSLRDLNELLAEIVTKDILERSRSVINNTRDLLPVFVPTLAYQRAYEIVRKHQFVMLEGPPEMGKSAIARMLALTHLAQGWDAIECARPSEFFQTYKNDRRQIFVADDAFGRTEYEPDRVLLWERDLDKVLSTLDRRHWLLWTSRKHILERARRNMDLQGVADKFPKPAEVLVDANFLTIREKALILYRHARNARLTENVKELIRRHAEMIVNQPAFTPERIRRFVKEDALSLNNIALDDPKGFQLTLQLVTQAIQNPTARMRISYNKLPPSHKWLLIALLDADWRCEIGGLARLYAKHCPESYRRPFDQLIEELAEAFLRTNEADVIRTHKDSWFRDKERRVQWIHPSYRDLVIEELATDLTMKRQFLENAEIEGIKLAISDTGGSTGYRKFPLINRNEDWSVVKKSVVRLSGLITSQQAGELLEVLRSAAEEAIGDKKRALSKILFSACITLKQRWDAGISFNVHDLDSYCRASLLAEPMPPLPVLDQIWERTTSRLKSSLDVEELVLLSRPACFSEWVELAQLIHTNEPRFGIKIGFPQKYKPMLVDVLEQIECELRSDVDTDDLAQVSIHASAVAEKLSVLNDLASYEVNRAGELIHKMKHRAQVLEAEAEAQAERFN